MANTSNSASADEPQKRGLFKRKPKPEKANKEPGRLKQIAQVFKMTRRHDPSVVWWMALVFLGVVAVGLVIGLLINNWVTLLLISIPIGLLLATIVLSRKAETAAFAQIEGRQGAAGAAMSTLKRGWNVKEEPVAVSPRTQDLVFMAIGKPGVVLVTEGPSGRVKPLVEGERRRMSRVLPNVPIHVINAGSADGQTKLGDVAKTMKKLPKKLDKAAVHQVDRRLSALGTGKLPVPKGIDPMRARPDRRSLRGR
ncbi:DUF4191 domain-containing protein [Zhihengliuella flava]|uniref:DUF4191 domain-containing protein n=1 Tax=Zhihengliuella flava TaxID=1285193 RepID=A0A931DAV9_9MICC|nr:DUF4191 domain-containing protein [Zhihengliuella flava]MBG6085657.1 hypothetical protein [Zhihengliuella flava]